MDNGILKKSLLSMKKIDLKGIETNFQEIVAYKHYLFCFSSAPFERQDCTIIDTEKETFASISIGLGLAKKSGFTISYWRDNIFVLYGGEDSEQKNGAGGGGGLFGGRPRGPQGEDYQVHFLEINEHNGDVSIATHSWGEKDPRWSNANHCAHIYKDNLYIFGGKGIKNSQEMWKFDLNMKTWSKYQIIGEGVYEPSQCRVGFDDKIYLIGSFKSTGFQRIWRNDLSVIDLETLKREKIYENDFLPSSNFPNLRADVIGPKIFISSPYLEEFLIYDPIQNKTEQSQGVSPKNGYRVRSSLGNSTVFRFFKSAFGGGSLMELQTLENLIISENSNERLQPVKINNKILPQASHMQLLWKDKLFADITFVVQDEEILAHKNILVKSHYFLTMFQSGMMESNSSKITVPDISPINFKAILEFIYFGKIVLTEKLALDLIVLADMYFLSDLKADCESYLTTCVSMTNFLNYMKVAETADAQKLEDKVASFLITNLEKISEDIDSSLIPQDLLIKAMKKMKFGQK